MKSSIYVLGIVLVSSLPLLAGDNLHKDVQDSLASLASMTAGSMTYAQQQERVDTKAERLVRKYGSELAGPAKTLATEPNDLKREFGFSVLIKLGPCDAVRQTFLDLIENSDNFTRNDAIYALARIDRGFAGKVAVEVLNTTPNPDIKASIIPLLSISGDPNTGAILKNMEETAKDVRLKEAARHARESLEHQMNLPTQEERKSWADQTFAYRLAPMEVERQPHIVENITYYEKARLLARRGHRFSLSFLKFHFSQKDPLAVAILGVQKEKDAVEYLRVYMNEKGHEGETFNKLCRMAYREIENKEQSPSKPQPRTLPGPKK